MKNSLVIIVFLFFLNSCSTDDEERNTEIIIDPPELLCGRPLDYSGTICCVSGSDTVIPGEIYSFEYNSNLINPVFNWEVVSGSISIISGQDTSIVTLGFGNDFTTGVIVCVAVGDETCSENYEINKR